MRPGPTRALVGLVRRAGAAIDLPVIWLLSGPGWWPLLSGRLPGTHDGYYHLYRLFELDRALRAGDLYPRWAPDFALGYGYPVFDYYPPLLLYLAAPFALAGAGPISALNLGQLAAVLAAGATMYCLARELFGRLPGLVAGTLYGSLPYLLVDLYVRGAVAETLALALLPLVALALRRAASAPSARTVALAGAAVGLLALGHNVTTLLGLPVLGAYAALVGVGWTGSADGRPAVGDARRPDTRRPALAARAISLAAAGALGLLAAAVYWLPALVERDLVQSELLTTLFYDFHNHFQPLREVVQRTLPFEYRYDYFGGFLFRAGLVQIALAVIGGGIALARPPHPGARRLELGFWGAVGLGALLLQSSRSAWLWEHAPLLGFVQFPWRMLALVGVASVLLVAGGLAALAPRRRAPASLGVVALWLVASFAQLRPVLLDLRPEEVSVGALGRIELERRLVGTTTAGEYTPRWERRGTFEGWRDPLPVGEGVEPLELLAAERNELRLRVAAPGGGTLVLDRYYFPGWAATADGRPAAVRPVGQRGLLGVDVPAGAGEVGVRFGGTPLRDASTWLSASAIAALGLLAGPPVRRRRRLGPGAGGLATPGEPAPSRRGRAATAVGVVAALAVVAAPPAGAPATASEVPVVRSRADFDGGPRLLGLAHHGGGRLTLYWTSTRPVGRELDVALRLIGADGRVVGRRDKRSRYGLRPSSLWRPGALVRDLQDVELLPGQAGGEVELVVGLHDATGYLAPTGGEIARWREECPCAAPGAEGVGVSVGRLRLGAAPERGAAPLPRAVEAGQGPGPVAAGRIQLLDLDLDAVDRTERRPLAPLWERVVRRLPGRLRAALAASEPDAPPPAAHLGGPARVLATLAPGDALDVSLRWRALADVDEDYAVFTHLLDHGQRLIAQDDEWPRRGFSPTSLWHSGQETLDRYRIRLRPDAPPGRYTLAVGLYRRADLQRLTWSGQPTGRDQIVLGSIKVAPPPPTEPVARRVEARFGAAIRLLGFDDRLGAQSVVAGATLTVAPRWYVEAAPERDYTVFVHLVDAGGKLVANGDAPPLGGGYPTSVWEPGEQIADGYRIMVPDGLRGPARLVVGLYRPDTGERLPIRPDADSIVAAAFDVTP
ncbi:MAG TPA: glycosyltransferase family 39 protein [Chloroflexota bacterium]|nr:glycosyltransferase family 39 protein [Chloroflexota bacterium]